MEASPKGPPDPSPATPLAKPVTLAAAMATLGVVFGDIGTSPLYALRETFKAAHDHAGAVPVIPVLSLVLWCLILVVSVKYVILVMEANDEGEGGVMTLVSLSSQGQQTRAGLVIIGMIGAALLYGDGVITPAISVLSAMEGIKEANERLQGPFAAEFLSTVIPWLAIGILIPLFAIQKNGTSRVGAYFGPVTLTWFLTLAALGVLSLVRHAHVAPLLLGALNPLEGFGLFLTDPGMAFAIIGAVFLAVTGAEALYADMGHFGGKPIRVTWHVVVLPALLLNYFGQAAWFLAQPERIGDPLFNPFFNMAPNWAQIPLVVLATLAAIIASQALISGAFSMTTQAIQLNYLPRMRILHTSGEESGQVYLPAVNWGLFAGCTYAVLQFGTSERLAGAYGISVSLTMLCTSILFSEYLRKRKGLGAAAYVLMAPFLILELVFITGNLPKIVHGGWLPLTVAFLAFSVMHIWNRGRQMMKRKFALDEQKDVFDVFIDSVEDRFHAGKLRRVSGVAVYMVGNTEAVPMAFAHNLKHNKVVHEHILVMTLRIDEYRATVPAAERVQLTYRVPNPAPAHGRASEPFPRVLRVIGHYGFRELAQVEPVLRAAFDDLGIAYDPMQVTFFLSRETVVRSESDNAQLRLPKVEEKIFEVLNRNSLAATAYFKLPPGRVVELGMQVEM
jgi:KUP system potassium uptake protein